MQNALHVARRQEVGKLCDREQSKKGVEMHFRGENDRKKRKKYFNNNHLKKKNYYFKG